MCIVAGVSFALNSRVWKYTKPSSNNRLPSASGQVVGKSENNLFTHFFDEEHNVYQVLPYCELRRKLLRVC
jgi:hypothetical protein